MQVAQQPRVKRDFRKRARYAIRQQKTIREKNSKTLARNGCNSRTFVATAPVPRVHRHRTPYDDRRR